MAPKSVMTEFYRRILKRPSKDSSNRPGSAGSKDPKFTFFPGSSTPKLQLQEKQKGKKVATKEKEAMHIDEDSLPTFVGKSELMP